MWDIQSKAQKKAGTGFFSTGYISASEVEVTNLTSVLASVPAVELKMKKYNFREQR